MPLFCTGHRPVAYDRRIMSRPPPRLFIDTPLSGDQTVTLLGNPAHYLGQVLRLSPGAKVSIFNGRDGEWLGKLGAVSRKACTLTALHQTREQSSVSGLVLAFAPLKKTPMGFLVTKATELGVGVLQPVITERTETARINLDRLTAQSREAAEQCERLDVPKVAEPKSLTEFLGTWLDGAPLWTGDETGEGRPFTDVLSDWSSAGEAPSGHGILIGPEGGFTHNEFATLDLMAFVTRVDLGPRILRAETATLAALTCWQALLGDWRQLKSMKHQKN